IQSRPTKYFRYPQSVPPFLFAAQAPAVASPHRNVKSRTASGTQKPRTRKTRNLEHTGSRMHRIRRLIPIAAVAIIGAALSGCTGAGAGGQALPSVQVQVGQGQGESLTLGVQLLLLLTVLSLVPAVLMMMTSFVRIAIVLSFARSAI